MFRQIKLFGYRGDTIDEIYIDEVQDFTQGELRLFVEICGDKNALFLTGDTCQTIARGVGFRFEELTTMFKRLEQQRNEAESLRDSQRVRVPTIQKLTVNYRTHNGIRHGALETDDIWSAFAGYLRDG